MTNFVRTIRLRSTVDAEFSPRYNRLSYQIDPDDFSSDLSQSYLALRLYLTTTAGVQYTKNDLQTLADLNTFVSFGQNDQSYSPLCLIKTARLFNGSRTQVLEEINFANVLYCTLNQLKNDFESVSSTSLLSNTAVTFGSPQSMGAMFANLLPDFVGNGQQVPIEIHLKLSDIFGFFKSQNCHLNDAVLNGLRLEFELEDTKSLFHTQVIGEKKVIVSPLLPVNSTGMGLVASLAYNPYNSLTAQNNIGQMTQGIIQTNVPDPNGNLFQYKAPKIFQSQQISQPSLPADGTYVSRFTLMGTYTAGDILTLGLATGNFVKLNFRLSPVGGLTDLRADKIMSRIDAVVTLAISNADNLIITVLGQYSKMISDTQYTSSLDSIEFIDAVPVGSVLAGDFANLFATGTITITDANKIALQTIGAISSLDLPLPYKFNLYAQITASTTLAGVSTAVITQITNDVFLNPDSSTSRHCVSNSLKSMPLQGGTCQLLSVVANGQNWDITFKNLGMVNNNSLYNGIIQNGVIFQDGSTIVGSILAVTYEFFMTDYNSSDGARFDDDYSYMIDRAELVLVQSAKDKGMPMSRVYTTTKVEVATIETDIPYYNRQFVVTEPNVYNLLLVTPQYVGSATQPESLISQRRGVQEYRWSVNNIDATNRLIEVGTNSSFYPSSLYLESLMDSLSNGSIGTKTLAGQLTIPHSDTPVVMYPLKIYKASPDGMNFMFRQSGFTCQITLVSDMAHDTGVTAGNIFLFKQCIKTL